MSNSPADFFIFVVRDLTPEDADNLAALAFDWGASGTEENLPFEQKSREYEPVTLTPERTELKIYFETAPDRAFAETIQLQFPEARVEILQEQNRDWLAEWKKGFEPFALAGDIWVVPSWREIPPSAKSSLRIDPGMAFGTGTHETTRLAASFIYDFGQAAATHNGETSLQQGQVQRSLLDVGTGTGILALQAEIVGFTKVLANDIDPEARRVARECLELNQSKRVRILDEDLAQIEGQFDWVVANIIDGVLVKLQVDLKIRVASGGHLLLTGILQEREALFREEFSFAEFDIVERRQLGEWVGYLLKKSEA
jgi:ribosomal protein L11 methyltransferase